ncbi:c-type cytochrome [Thiohalobacter sp.]|uniref:c-type cytochrome n=1 Tax=Thiohalobacter sp. TaxID=2025948 RepID=UPI0026016F0F|nr:cytochrome c [Thiohalobacter sp.]
MKTEIRNLVLGLGSLLMVSVSALPALAAENVKDMEGDFARGAQVWVNNCTRCHNARDPREFRDDLWRPIVFHMRIRGGLTGQDTRDVLKFLQESN